MVSFGGTLILYQSVSSRWWESDLVSALANWSLEKTWETWMAPLCTFFLKKQNESQWQYASHENWTLYLHKDM